LPKLTELMRRYGVAKETASKAIHQLAAEGLVEVIRKRGTVIRERPMRQRLVRERAVYRDEIGYYFDRAAQPWRALATPTITRGPVPWDVAGLLGLRPGDEVIIRDRIMGDQQSGQVYQLATTYLPADLVDELPVLEEPDTGPGGIYDRLEAAGHGPLAWHETYSARAPQADEVKLLRLKAGVPVLRIIRTATDPRNRVCEVNDSRLNAELWEIGAAIRRHSSAHPASKQ
jgi:GntR family transcriptional regulator